MNRARWMRILVNGFIRLTRFILLRRRIYGKIGRKNCFRPHVQMTSEAVVGNYNYFGDGAMVGMATIGNYCSIAPNVKIGQSQHSIDYITTYNAISKKNIGYKMTKSPAIIGNDVWIGANAVIMQGVRILDGAVIGANAVVTKDVPAFGIAVGVPAKVIRLRLNEAARQEILNSHWWDADRKQAGIIVKNLEKYL